VFPFARHGRNAEDAFPEPSVMGPPTDRPVGRLACLWAAALCAGCVSRTALGPEVAEDAVRARIVAPAYTVRQLDALVTRPAAREPSPEPDLPLFNLSGAVSYALEHNPRLTAAREAVNHARGAEQVAFSAFLPELVLATRYAVASPTLSAGAPGPVGGVEGLPGETHAFAQAELEIYWLLYDFGRSSGHYGQAVARERLAELRQARLVQTVAFEAATAYLNALRALALIAIRKDALRAAEAFLQDARVRFEGGVAERDNVLRAEVQVAADRDALAQARRGAFDALARLNFVLGRGVALPLRLEPRTPQPDFDRSLAQCLEAAAEQRAEIGAAREEVAAAARGLDAARAGFLPRIYLRAGIGDADGQGIRTGPSEGVGLHLDQPLYVGGRHEGERATAEADLRATVSQAQLVFDGVSLEVNLAFRSIASARERLRYTGAAVTEAHETLRLVGVRYRNGTATPADVVDAEAASTQAEQTDASARFDYLAALIALEYAMGAPAGCLSDPPQEIPVLPPPRPDPDGAAP
jgi:outer membrane protein